MSFGLKIRELRKLKGLSQQDLADHIGVSKQSIWKYEQEKAIPDWENVVKLTKFIGGDIKEVETLWLISVNKDKEVSKGVGVDKALTREYLIYENNRLHKKVEDLLKQIDDLKDKYERKK